MKRLRGNMANESWGKGQGIRIAHIDSGINQAHSHIGRVAGGIAFHVAEDGSLFLSEDCQDELGHGTAVAGVLYEHVPNADVWAVKIFHDRLSAYMEPLCAAVEWCIDAKMHIINLSLGVRRDDPDFRELCAEAEKKGIFIVSAYDEERRLLWPASYPSVFGVKAGADCSSNIFFYHPEDNIAFSALGIPRRLEGPLQKFNLQGHSFAAAHITGFLAKIREKYSIQSKVELEYWLSKWLISHEKPAANRVC
jgi:subtilisin